MVAEATTRSLFSACTIVVLSAPAIARQDLEPGAANADAAPSIRSHQSPLAEPTDFGGVAGGFDCAFNNYFPLDDRHTPASQRDIFKPFWAEAAADFMITGEDDTTCTVDLLIAGVYFFNPRLRARQSTRPASPRSTPP